MAFLILLVVLTVVALLIAVRANGSQSKTPRRADGGTDGGGWFDGGDGGSSDCGSGDGGGCD